MFVRTWIIPLFSLLLLFPSACSKSSYEGPAVVVDNPQEDPETPLYVVSIAPPDGADDRAPDTVIEVVFSLPPAAATLTGGTFSVVDSETETAVKGDVLPVIGQVDEAPKRFQFVPDEPLRTPAVSYRIELSPCIRTEGGKFLDLEQSNVPVPSTFTTGKTPDLQAPRFTIPLLSATAVGPTSIELSWPPALDPDNRTLPPNIYYVVYSGASPDAINYEVPASVTLPGASGCTVTGCEPNTSYWFIVHPVDEAGNEDDNTIILSAKTFLPEESQELTVLYSADVFATLEPCG